MASTLKNVVSFVAVGPGVQVGLPHGINREGTGLVPDVVNFSNPAFTIVACDDTTLTIQNNSVVAEDCDALCENWHSQDRNFVTIGQAALSPQPFVPQGDSGSVGGIYPSVLVYRPGGVAAGNVYTDFEDLVAAKALIEGPVTIEFDDSIVSPAHVPAPAIPGTRYPMEDTEWQGRSGYSQGGPGLTQVVIDNGAAFTRLLRISRNIVVDQQNVAPNPSPMILANGDAIELHEFAMLVSGGGVGSVPFFSATDIWFELHMQEGCETGGHSASIIDVVASAPGIAGFELYIGNDCHVWDDSFSGDVNSERWHYPSSPSALIDLAQTAWLGATYRSYYQIDQAYRMNPEMGVVPSIAPVGALHGSFVRLNATAGVITQPLPTIAAGYENCGRSCLIKETSGVNSVIVDPPGAETINGALTYTIPPGGAAKFTSDGVSDWTVESIYDPREDSSNVFVFRPGGVTAPTQGVYATWPELMFALGLSDGPKTIEFDDSIVSPCVIPAPTVPGTPYGMTNTEWTGLAGKKAETSVLVATGVSFTGLRRFVGSIRILTQVMVVSPVADLVGAEKIELTNDVDISTPTGSAPFFSQAGVVATSVEYILRSGSTFGSVDNNGPVIGDVVPTGRIYLTLGDDCRLGKRSLQGGAGADCIILRLGAYALVYMPQSNWLGNAIQWWTLSKGDFWMDPPAGEVPSIVPISLITAVQSFVRLNATAGVITQPLPTIAGGSFTGGKEWIIKETSGLNSIIVDGFGAETIEGALTYTVPPGGTVRFISDGVSNWTVVADPMFGSSSTFVFRPGGVANPSQNIFTTWPSLMAALVLRDGPRVLQFDNSIVSPCVIPAGSYNMTNVAWSGLPEGGTYVTLADGCLFTGLLRITRNLRIENNNTVTSPFILNNQERLELIDGVDLCTNFGGVIPAVTCVAGVGNNIYIRLDSGSSLGVSNSGVVAQVAGNQGLTLEMGDNTLVMDNVLVGANPASLILNLYSPSAKVKPQAAWIKSPGWVNTQDQAFRLNPQPDVVPSVAEVLSLSFGEFIRLNATAGLFVQHLPQIVGPGINDFHSAGRWIAIKETSGLNGITVTPFAGDTIDGAATFSLSPGGEVLLISAGVTDWRVISVGLNQLLNRVNTFTKAQGTAQVNLPDNVAGITPDLTLSNSHQCLLGAVAGNTRQLGVPTGAVAGFTYIFEFVQPAGPTAVQALTYNAAWWKFPGGTIPVLTPANDARDILTFYYDGAAMCMVSQLNFRNP